MLRVVKSAPRFARVGQRIRFSLTVTNVGTIDATSVQVADVPPAALTLSGLAATSGMRRVRGNAVWRLGTLAPGATRTVRGSVIIKSGTSGSQAQPGAGDGPQRQPGAQPRRYAGARRPRPATVHRLTLAAPRVRGARGAG